MSNNYYEVNIIILVLSILFVLIALGGMMNSAWLIVNGLPFIGLWMGCCIFGLSFVLIIYFEIMAKKGDEK